MTQHAIQEATAAILSAYLTNHEVKAAELPSLMVNVGLALRPVPQVVPTDKHPQLQPRRRGKRFRDAVDLETRRIEHVDQIEMVWQDSAVEALSGEGRDQADYQPDEVPETDLTPTRPNTVELVATTEPVPAQDRSETTMEDGVKITRLPEVKRGRRRLA